MTDPTPRPSRLLKLAATTAPWVLGLVLGMWLLFGLVWAALHGWIVPRIEEFRPRIEAGLTRALGTPLRIGSIRAQGGPLVPSFEIKDIVLLDADGREALRLDRVVALLSPRSLLRLGFEQLVVDGPVLDIRRDAQGRIRLAGMDLTRGGGGSDGRAADWVFSQRELVVRKATVRWSDALTRSADVELRDADLIIRNGHRQHLLRLDATPPADWGERFSLRATMRQSLLSPRRGNWREWDGQVFADLPRIDLARLQPQLGTDGSDWATAVQAGHGAVRAWADVVHGEVLGGTLDLALQGLAAQVGGRPPLAFAQLQGRLRARQLAGGLELATEQLQVASADGTPWPGGDLFLSTMQGESRVPGQGVLRAERLDLAALADAASRLPLSSALREAVASRAPRGVVEGLQLQWNGRIEAPADWRARGRVAGLALAAGPLAEPQPGNLHPVARPGVRGLNAQFDLTQAGGQAELSMQDGLLEFPGVFDEASVPIATLTGALRWQVEGTRLAVQVPSLRFANADAAGELQANWHTREAPHTLQRPRLPGVLELVGTLGRADGTRAHRYLPLGIPPEARHYVRDAVQQGRADSVRFRVKGDLHDFPFRDPRQGEFQIAAQVRDVQYAFVPTTVQPAGAVPWPALTQLAGELVFDRVGMRVRGATGRLGNLPVAPVEADIADFHQSVVAVRAEARAPLADMLAVVRGSPLAAMTENALAQASASGAAELKLQLALPLADLAHSKVQGQVVLAGNDLQFLPGTPLLARTRGSVQFNESGFTLAGVQGRVFGGDVRLEGSSRPGGGEPRVVLRAQGVATAEGLRQAPELGALAQLAQRASGSAPYSLVLGVRHGEPEISVTSSLQGLGLDLPAPLGKPAEAAWPLRVERTLPEAGGQDQWTVDVGQVLNAVLVRDLSGASPRVLRGAVGVDLLPGESAPLPASGIFANVRLGTASLDDWQAALAGLGAPATASTAAGAAPATAADEAYLPDRFILRAEQLTLGGRTLHQLVAGGSREASTWRANLRARELEGYVEYRQGGDAGRVHARLTRLTIESGAEDEVTTLLDEQPSSVPALDVVIDDFELRGKKLGHLEMQAINRGGGGSAEWRLNRLSLDMPEARFTASGNWAALGAQAPMVQRARAEQRRTAMNFRLDIHDAGALLARLGMHDVVRRGQGTMEGRVAWIGSPLALDTASLGGQFHVDVENGQFLKADPGLAKLLGVLSLQSLPRRLTLDFRDVFTEGFAFDFVRGDLHIEQGIAGTNNLQMKGVNAAVLMDGRADIARETQDLRVVVVPEINAGTASLVATVINPAIGIGTFLAQVFLRRPLMEAATQQFHIDGSWSDPRIERVPRGARSDNADDKSREAALPAPTGVTR